MSKHRTCGGKRRYRDKQEAQRVLRLMASRSERQKVPTRAYYCAVCSGWHLTSQPDRHAGVQA